MYRLTGIFLLIALFSACTETDDLSDAYGNFEVDVTTISSEANGRLLFLDVSEGAKLDIDKLVAQVDTTQLHLQRAQIRASIQTLPKKLRNTLDDIEVLQRQRANLVRERDRVERLIAKQAATPKQLDDLNGKIEVVDQQIAALRTQTQTGNSAILAEKGPLLAQIEIINEQIRRSTVYNPVEGTVLTKMAEPYELVRAGSPLYRIGSLDTMTLRFYVDGLQLQDIKLGQEIEVLIDSGEDGYKELTGKISWISAQAEFTPKTIQTKKDRVNLVYALKAKVPNSEGFLKIGMPAEVNFNK
ncbi:MAG: HlyD family secretion protein [Bacteroidetes bacterium]|nr:MAG: HlyD family secretion protein [Bacteroidota bacterium]